VNLGVFAPRREDAKIDLEALDPHYCEISVLWAVIRSENVFFANLRAFATWCDNRLTTWCENRHHG
jgi:hypothetical protein